jgi:hypothetical protein
MNVKFKKIVDFIGFKELVSFYGTHSRPISANCFCLLMDQDVLLFRRHFPLRVDAYVRETTYATNDISRVGKTICRIARIEFAMMMCVGLSSERG